MSTDLDQRIRQAFERRALDAPREVDMAAVLRRTDALARRRRAAQAAGGAVAATLVLVAALAVTRPTSEPPPATTNSPQPPTATRLTTDEPVPTATASAVPWTAWTTGSASGKTRVLVRTGVGLVTLTGLDGAASVRVLAWMGPDHRTLVLALGSGDGFEQRDRLVAVELAGDGGVARAAEPLRLGEGIPEQGRALTDTTGGLVWLWQDPAQWGTWYAAHVDEDLSTRRLPTLDNVEPVFAAIGDTVLASTLGGGLKISRPGGTSERFWVCPNSGIETMTVSTRWTTAVACQDRRLVLTSALPRQGAEPSTQLAVEPDDGLDPSPGPLTGRVRQVWFTADGQLAASALSDDSPLSTWLYDTDGQGSGTWRRAPVQGVRAQVYSGGVHFTLTDDGKGGGTWSTGTSPTVQLGPGETDPDFLPTLVARPR